MTVEGLDPVVPVRAPSPIERQSSEEEDEIVPAPIATEAADEAEGPRPARPSKSYKSPIWITVLGYLLFSVVVLANAYVIVQLGLGNA